MTMIDKNLPANLLIVDDTADNLRLLTNMLTEQGYKARPANNGGRAIAAALKSPPDLILLDIMMPDMDGYEVCRQLKANVRFQDVPIIFISALDEVFDKLTAFSVGGVDYITKPFQVEEVLARVKTHLTIRHLQQELHQKNAALQQANESLEETVQSRTAELATANKTLQTEIEQRIQHQAEKDRLFKVVSQQSDQLRTLTTLLIETQSKERQGLVTGLRIEISQNITVLQGELNLLQTILQANPNPVLQTHLENAKQLIKQIEIYIHQVTLDLHESTAKVQHLSENPLVKLTSREREVLQLIAQGKTQAEIAEILTIATTTIHTYTSRIKRKLNIHNVPGLIKFAMSHQFSEWGYK